MNKLMTLGALAIAGLFTTGMLAAQAPVAFAGGDDSSVVRATDDRGRDHAEDGPRREARHHGHDDHGHHHGHHHHHHGHDDHGHHGDHD